MPQLSSPTPDATTTTKGKIQLASGLGGSGSTAASPKLVVQPFLDYFESGCVWTADAAGSTKAASMTSGVVWISGKRLTVAAVTSRTFTASKDVYVDFTDNSDGTAVPTYIDNTTNAASPALTTNGVRNAIVVVGASNIANAAAINQGEETKLLPIASSIPYAVTDSLGNLICSRDPNHRTLGYRQITSSFVTNTSGSDVDITGLSFTVNVPTGRKIKLKGYSSDVGQGATTTLELRILEGATLLQSSLYKSSATIPDAFLTPEIILTPSAGVHTYKLTVKASAGTGTSVIAGATNPCYLLCELM